VIIAPGFMIGHDVGHKFSPADYADYADKTIAFRKV